MMYLQTRTNANLLRYGNIKMTYRLQFIISIPKHHSLNILEALLYTADGRRPTPVSTPSRLLLNFGYARWVD